MMEDEGREGGREGGRRERGKTSIHCSKKRAYSLKTIRFDLPIEEEAEGRRAGGGVGKSGWRWRGREATERVVCGGRRPRNMSRYTLEGGREGGREGGLDEEMSDD